MFLWRTATHANCHEQLWPHSRRFLIRARQVSGLNTPFKREPYCTSVSVVGYDKASTAVLPFAVSLSQALSAAVHKAVHVLSMRVPSRGSDDNKGGEEQ